MIRVVLRGEPAAVAAALDVLAIRAAVEGVWERDPRCAEVWLAAEPAPWPELAVVCAVERDAGQEPRTGLEDDVPVFVLPDLVVRPPWVARPEGFCGVELVVPRGMAFGSGEHDSTQAALVALHESWPVAAPRTALDVGTGSGILARYAAARGVPRVCACDVESAAVAAARALLPGADVRLGGPEVFDERFDLVIANLDGAQLAAALAAIAARWNGRGPLVLSGLRESELERLLPRLPAAPVCVVARGAFRAAVIAAR